MDIWRDLIVNGRAKPSKIESHLARMEDARGASDKFYKRTARYTEVLIRFGEANPVPPALRTRTTQWEDGCAE